jgi:tight adherence protein C
MLASGSLVVALATAGMVLVVLEITTRDRGDESRRSAFEVERRRTLRRLSRSYRLFEPLIDELQARPGPGCRRIGERLARHLAALGGPAPWTAGAYLATKQVEGVIAGSVVGALAAAGGWGTATAMILVPAVAVGYVATMLQRQAALAARRLQSLRRRLPFSVDLMALMMEAGSSFDDSLRVVARELDGEDLSELFQEVLGEIERGLTRRQALERARDRMRLPELTELVFAIIEGEDLGTPLKTILKAQARQARQKRYQWLEAATAKAQVYMVLPGTISMLASLIIVVAPFLLPAIKTGSLFSQ